MSHLQRHLEQASLLGREQLETALRRQQIYGGSLDTVILELELLDPITLNGVLGAATGHATAPARLLRPQTHRPWNQISPDLLDLGWASPLGLENGLLMVAVHPDLPERELLVLQQSAPGARLLVTAECVMARLAAERNGSVIPHRYAVLSARFLQALAYTEDRAATEVSHDSAASGSFPPMSLIRTDDPYDDARSSDSSQGQTREAPSDSWERAPISSRSHSSASAIPATELSPEDTDEQDLTRTLASHRITLERATERDEITQALARAALVLTPRVALFGVKHGNLVALEIPDSTLDAMAGSTVPIETDGALEQALAGRETEVMDRVYDLDLRLAVGQEAAIPCSFHVVRVRERPVLALYLDRNGDPFYDIENRALAELCRVAAQSLEELLLRRQQARAAGVISGPADSSEALVGPPPTAEPERESTDVNELPSLVHDSGVHRGATLIARKPLAPPPSSPPPADSDVYPIPPLVLDGASAPDEASVPPPPVADLDPDSEDHRPTTIPGIPRERLVAEHLRATNSAGDSSVIALQSPLSEGSSRGHIFIEPDEPELVDSSQDALPTDPVELEADRAVIEVIEREGDSVSRLRALGRPALLRMASRFPGPLEVLRRDLAALPPPSAHGPLIRATIRLGRDMTPFLCELMDHADDEVRFYAAFVFQELRDPSCASSLAELAFDDAEDVRTIAMRVLETYALAPGFSQATKSIRNKLGDDDERRQRQAAQAVGTLRDVHSIPALIELLGHPDDTIRQTALESLCSITGQQHGVKPSRWHSWFETHRHRHRIEWIIDSLRHRELAVRRWAYDELVRITGHRVAHSPSGDKRAQSACVDAWVNWWEAEGRYRHATQ